MMSAKKERERDSKKKRDTERVDFWLNILSDRQCFLAAMGLMFYCMVCLILSPCSDLLSSFVIVFWVPVRSCEFWSGRHWLEHERMYAATELDTGTGCSVRNIRK